MLRNKIILESVKYRLKSLQRREKLLQLLLTWQIKTFRVQAKLLTII